MKRIVLILLASISLLVASTLFAQQQMPPYILHAAQTLNAQYNANIDVNNVYWNYVAYNQDLAGANADCDMLSQAAPPLNGTRVYLVEFEPVRNGLPSGEFWEAMVYEDMSFVALCEAPLPEATPLPGVAIATITPSNCGSMPSRLVIGQEGRVAAGDNPNNLRAEPFVSGQYLGEIPPLGIFLVLDGPRCSADGAWWYVNYNGTAGWTLEGQGGSYYLEPMSLVGLQATVAPTLAPLVPPPSPVVCNPSMPSRMIIGALGRVTPGIPNNVRAQAGSSAQYLGEIPAEGIFDVLAGPVCASGIAWWQVDYGGLVGWTAEGADGDYWIEPQFAAFEPISLENIGNLRLRQYANFALPNSRILQFNPNNALFVASDTMLVRQEAANGFVEPAAISWGQGAPDNRAYLAFQLVGNIPQWLAVQDADAVSVQYFDGFEQREQARIPLIASKAIFSPDARYLMLVDSSQQIHVFDTSVGQETAIIPATGTEPILGMAFSPDGRYFAAYSVQGTILWAAGSWEVLDSNFSDTVPASVQITGMALNNYQLAYSLVNNANEQFLITENIADLRTGLIVSNIAVNGSIQDFVLANDGSFVLIATDGGLEFAEIPNEVATFNATLANVNLGGVVREMSLSRDGRFLAVATDANLSIWGVGENQ